MLIFIIENKDGSVISTLNLSDCDMSYINTLTVSSDGSDALDCFISSDKNCKYF
jgi:hypothetical protein